MKAVADCATAKVDWGRRRALIRIPLLAGALAVGMAQAATRRRDFDASAVATLFAWMEVLVPGAGQAGAAQFVAAQLTRPRGRACLTLRYLDWPGSYRTFYEQGIAALDALAKIRYARRFATLGLPERDALVADIVAGRTPDWEGPPGGLFYFVSRADAVDVVYGTVAGFARLGVPYRPHVAPPLVWPAAV